MSAKNLDAHGRLRSVTVGFRVSPEESELLSSMAALSGLTKQDFIIRQLLNREIIVQGNPRVFKALKSQFAAVLHELKRIEQGGTVSAELQDLIAYIAKIMNGMKEESEWTDIKI